MASPNTHSRFSPHAPAAPVPVVLWRDIFALVDRGRTSVSDYPALEAMVRKQAEQYPRGLGCLVIIPANADPPPDDVRRAINDVLTRLAPSLLCLCWLVEGRGFRAAAVRAALAGLRIARRPPYPTTVASDMIAALRWIILHLPNGGARMSDIPIAAGAISEGRTTLLPSRP
jgi:hypothetical protein